MENNKIVKTLKYATFTYDEDTKEFTLHSTEHGMTFIFNKTYAFAFQRFLTRISSRNWFRKQKKMTKGVINK